jgi:hypothetical protein
MAKEKAALLIGGHLPTPYGANRTIAMLLM